VATTELLINIIPKTFTVSISVNDSNYIPITSIVVVTSDVHNIKITNELVLCIRSTISSAGVGIIFNDEKGIAFVPIPSAAASISDNNGLKLT
jgi:hypothetical protein